MDLIVLQRGRTRATIAPEAGGRLLQLEVRPGESWVPLLRAPRRAEDALAEPTQWGSFAMVPWPNRIENGRFTWRGRLYGVPARDRHAIHGIGCYQPWRLEHATRSGCSMTTQFSSAWPFGGYAVQHLRLHDDGISQRIEVHATSAPFPAGAGWHPWFLRRVSRHDARALVDATHRYHTDGMIPTGWIQRVSGESDLRRDEPLGKRRLDVCYSRPRGALQLRWGDLELTIRSSPNVAHAVVYTPEHAFCVEPQTCAIDAFNLTAQGIDAGVTVVTPGRPLVATTTWRWRIVE